MENIEVSIHAKALLAEEDSMLSGCKDSKKYIDIGDDRQENVSADAYETGFNAIEDALHPLQNSKKYAFPHPRQWISPRVFSVWIFPVIVIKKIRRFSYSIYCYLCE